MDTRKGFINPLWMLVGLVIVVGAGAAWWVIQQAAPQEWIPVGLPIVEDVVPAVTSDTEPETSMSNVFTVQSKPGDKVGDMVLTTIRHPKDPSAPAQPGAVFAEFTGSISVKGTLAAPTGNPQDAGIGPLYSLHNLTQDSIEKLPRLQGDLRTVWFGFKDLDALESAAVRNGDLVEIFISKYEYTLFPTEVWNQVEMIGIRKVQ